MPLRPPPHAEPPPRLAGRRLSLEPITAPNADTDLRRLFAACSRRVAGGCDLARAFADSMQALAGGSCLAWIVSSLEDGERLGLAWLRPGFELGAQRGIPTAHIGARWANGEPAPAPLERELLLLLLGYAFERRRCHALDLRDLRADASAPLLASEWPALRASLEERGAA